MGLDGFILLDKEILSIVDTPGGYTYYVMDNGDWKGYCLRPVTERGKEFQFCSNVPGEGTSHVGTGACKYHSGIQAIAPGIRSDTPGRYSKVLKKQLRQLYEEYAQDPDLLNLSDELALQRAVLMEALTRYDKTKGGMALQQVANVLKDVTKTVERIERIQSNQTLTVASSRMMMIIAMQVAQQFMQGDRLQEFLQTWREAVLERYTQNPLEPPKRIT